MAASKKNAFVSAVEATPAMAHTANGALTHASSLSACVDFFFLAGASRATPDNLVGVFAKAFAEDRDIATRLLLWMRDAREGAGERNAFRVVMKNQMTVPSFAKYARKLIEVIPTFGRWDDMLIFLGTRFQDEAVARIKKALETPEESSLCAKWMPRKGMESVVLRKGLGLSPKQYRKTLVRLSTTVEQSLCAKNFTAINYSQVPSVAAHRYQATFTRHDPAGYKKYRDDLQKVMAGETPSDPKVKVNASVIYPYQITQSIRGSYGNDVTVSLAQWEALPNWLNADRKILPVVDVSGSMNQSVSGGTSAMEVSVSLGLYIADKQPGPFKDMVLTFNTDSRFELLKGNIVQKINQLRGMDWGGSTSLESAFRNILDHAVKNAVPQEDMPSILLVISDMEFNPHTSGNTNFNGMKQLYEAKGYSVPSVVFWNVCGCPGNSPTTAHEQNVAMVSGFSPAIMTSVLGANTSEFTPKGIMLKTALKERYNVL